MANSNLSKSDLSEAFMKDFNKKKDEVNSRINGLSIDSGNTEEQLSHISADIQKMSKSLHDAIMFLPSYSIKIRQNEIRDLERLLKEKEDELVPKKKFGFKSKIKPTQIKEDHTVQLETKVPPPDSEIHKAINMDSNYFTIENIKHQTVHYNEKSLNTNDVLVKDCEESIIVLVGGPSTLRLANLKNCKLICGPVRTSIFIDKVFDSILYLCCQQLRTHSSERLDIYLRVASRAIIEDCTKIRFGPYQWDNEKSKELHQKAGIDANLERVSSIWITDDVRGHVIFEINFICQAFDHKRYDAVDDFNWLSATHSPNWCIIPEGERKSFAGNGN